MRTALVMCDGVKQIMLTPETEGERQALSLISVDDVVTVATKNGSLYGDSYGCTATEARRFGAVLAECRAGYLRAFDSKESVVLVLRPKAKAGAEGSEAA